MDHFVGLDVSVRSTSIDVEVRLVHAPYLDHEHRVALGPSR
ncbi:hypothetical protein AEGHOMDF_3902 [Methylobacterium soli]|nr:hypothetical protein AEGHOMDF_3902 [Methylobacterium soli]